MPDLGQVPQCDARIVASGLVPVIAVAGGDRLECDDLVSLSGNPGGQPPGPVPAGRAVGDGGRERESRPAAALGGPVGRVVTARRDGLLAFSPVCRGAPWFGPGAAVADRVPVLVGDRRAPGGPGVAGGGACQVPGQCGVDGANSVRLAGPADVRICR